MWLLRSAAVYPGGKTHSSIKIPPQEAKAPMPTAAWEWKHKRDTAPTRQNRKPPLHAWRSRLITQLPVSQSVTVKIPTVFLTFCTFMTMKITRFICWISLVSVYKCEGWIKKCSPEGQDEAIHSYRIWEDKITSLLQGHIERPPICTHTYSQV